MILSQKDLEQLIDLALCASSKIIEVYSSDDFGTRIKEDKSPLTLADQLSHKIIVQGLKNAYPQIPVISEESKTLDHDQRKRWDYFWLVDPLDGTKEFINKRGEFTVNIALINRNKPILGVVSLPALGVVYYGEKEKGAYLRDKDGSIKPIHSNKDPGNKIIIARSFSHSQESEDKIIAGFGDTETISAGSSLKFCYVAEGKADVYLRSGPTYEWDTAAGQCIAEASGATMTDLSGAPFLYNKESLKNPGFICACQRSDVQETIKSLI